MIPPMKSNIVLGTLVESVSDHFEPHASSLLTLRLEDDGGGGEVDHLLQTDDVDVGGGFSGDGAMLMFSSIFFPLTFHVPSHNFKSLKVVYSGSLCVSGMDEEVRMLHFLVDV